MNEFADAIDPQLIADIDIDEIGNYAYKDALGMVNDIVGDTYNEFFQVNPNIARRVESEIESLRLLLKMKRANEVAHDLAIKAVGQNCGNASMYKSLTAVQNQTQSIIKQIDEKKIFINNLLKNIQLELEFEPQQSEKTENSSVCRGTKQFINELRNKQLNEQ